MSVPRNSCRPNGCAQPRAAQPERALKVYSRSRQCAAASAAASSRPTTPRGWCGARRLQRNVRQPVRARLPTVRRRAERTTRPIRQAAGATPAVDDARLTAPRPGASMQRVVGACPAVPPPDHGHRHHRRRRAPPRAAATGGSPTTVSGRDEFTPWLEHARDLSVIVSARVQGSDLRHGARRGGLDVLAAPRDRARTPRRARQRVTSSAGACAGGPRPQTY